MRGGVCQSLTNQGTGGDAGAEGDNRDISLLGNLGVQEISLSARVNQCPKGKRLATKNKEGPEIGNEGSRARYCFRGSTVRPELLSSPTFWPNQARGDKVVFLAAIQARTCTKPLISFSRRSSHLLALLFRIKLN